MALEAGTYISDLDPNNPTGQDDPKQGDDHLRLIKSVLKNTFPNIYSDVTITDEELNNLVDDIAKCVLKSGDTMTGDLLMVDYKGFSFATAAAGDVFAKVVGVDDHLNVTIYDAAGSVLSQAQFSADAFAVDKPVRCTTSDGADVSEAITVEGGRQLLIAIDEKGSGDSGGDLTGMDDQWHYRIFTKEQYNGIQGASASGLDITLPAGLYRVYISCPAYRTDRHKTRLVDSLDVPYLGGTSEKSNEGDETQTRSIIAGVIDLIATTTLRVEHWVHLGAEGGQAFALGFPSSIVGEDEVYSTLEIEKI